ncbi:MAG TPA: hypothetical protein DIW31_01705 [Bacteroidales bacterium]|nr:hypothetical protein [Bacteroidales bacterium]
MKNISSIFKLLALTAALQYGFKPVFASSDEVKDKFELTYKVSASDKLVLNMYDSDLQINTWKSNEVKLTGEIIISNGSKEDIDKILAAFKNPKVEQGGGSIEINTVFSEGTIKIMGFYEKTKLTTGESVSTSSFKATYAIWVPESIAFNLKSKYNSVKSASLLGSIDFDLYNVDVEMGDFGDKSVFETKYSTVNAGKGKDAKFNIYDSKFVFDELNKVIVTSKYSKFTSKSINLLVLDSYNDTYNIENLKGVDMDAKYTTLNAKGTSNLGKFTLYNCNVEVGSFAKVEFDSKYSEFDAASVGSFAIKTSYNDAYTINELNDITCENSKYNKFHLGTVSSSVNLPSCYDSEISVQKIAPTFTSFKGDFKYGSVKLNVDPALNYRLICNSTYGKINYPRERFKNRPLVYIEKDSKIELDCSTSTDAKCEFNFIAYDLNFTIQ